MRHGGFYVGGTGLISALAFLTGCQTISEEVEGNLPALNLSGSSWMLIEYGGTKDEPGTEAFPNRYTLSLEEGGNAAFRLDCNYATTSWVAEPNGSQGTLQFGLIAATIAACPNDSIGERLAADMSSVRGYAIYDGRMTMTLSDSKITYVWERID